MPSNIDRQIRVDRFERPKFHKPVPNQRALCGPNVRRVRLRHLGPTQNFIWSPRIFSHATLFASKPALFVLTTSPLVHSAVRHRPGGSIKTLHGVRRPAEPRQACPRGQVHGMSRVTLDGHGHQESNARGRSRSSHNSSTIADRHACVPRVIAILVPWLQADILVRRPSKRLAQDASRRSISAPLATIHLMPSTSTRTTCSRSCKHHNSFDRGFRPRSPHAAVPGHYSANCLPQAR